VAKVRQGIAEERASIEAETAPAAAFARATRLVELLRAQVDEAAELRVRAAARIYEAESLSLAGLADRLGISKARAAQLINSSKSRGADQGPEQSKGGRVNE
jgi:hypothetical protein